MKIDILTIFPEMFAPLHQSILGRAEKRDLLKIREINIRDYTQDKHHTTDDMPYGGGSGMVMKPEPILAAYRSILQSSQEKPYVVMPSPRGKSFDQRKAKELSQYKHLIFLCGHYEGVDERVLDMIVDEEISVGDYVMTGGEIPAMTMIDACTRLIPGVLGDEGSLEEESFSQGLLEYPHYTRPDDFEGRAVPEVLLSGHHKNIDQWRREESLKKTWEMRPDLLKKVPLSDEDQVYLNDFASQQTEDGSLVFTALVHYPVYNKKRDVVTTSVTNLDMHDIARASRTYDVSEYFIVQPAEKQQEMIRDLLVYWKRGIGSRYNTDRKAALERVEVIKSLEEVKIHIQEKYQLPLKVIATAAQPATQIIGYQEMREKIEREKAAYLIVFGTGWGLEQSIIDSSDYVLRPINGPGDYNHLSVRSAASIILDRLLGERI